MYDTIEDKYSLVAEERDNARAELEEQLVEQRCAEVRRDSIKYVNALAQRDEAIEQRDEALEYLRLLLGIIDCREGLTNPTRSDIQEFLTKCEK